MFTFLKKTINFKQYMVNFGINKFLLPHNIYSGAKHIPLFSQRPFHLFVLLALSLCDHTNTIIYLVLDRFCLWVVANKYQKVFLVTPSIYKHLVHWRQRTDGRRRENIKNTAEHLKVERKEEMEHEVDFLTGTRQVWDLFQGIGKYWLWNGACEINSFR